MTSFTTKQQYTTTDSDYTVIYVPISRQNHLLAAGQE